MEHFRLQDLYYLFFLLIPLFIIIKKSKTAGSSFGGFSLISNLKKSNGPFVFKTLFLLGISLLIIALARPQYGRTTQVYKFSGRDISLVIDLSGSMQLDDMQDDEGNRIDRLKTVVNAANTFIDGRPNDRISLVVFAESSYTSCHLTIDHKTLKSFLKKIEDRQREMWDRDDSLVGERTNIGLGLGIAIKWLKKSIEEYKEKEPDKTNKKAAIVLITDGADSRELPNWVDPLEAAASAKKCGIKIYAIGVGDKNGTVTVTSRFGTKHLERVSRRMLPDLPKLKHISKITGGIAMPANNKDELQKVFEEINKLEPTPKEITTKDDFSDRFFIFLLFGTILIFSSLMLEPRLRGGL